MMANLARRDLKTRRFRLRDGERRTLLVIGDLTAAAAAAVLALALWAERDYLGFTPEFIRARAAWFFLLPAIWLVLMVNLYDVRRAGSWPETFRGIFVAAAGGGALYLVVYFSSLPGSLPRLGILYYLVIAVALTVLWRSLYIRVFTAPGFMRRILIIGAGESGKTLIDVVKGLWPPPFYLVGLVDDDRSKQGHELEGFQVMGGNATLLELIDREAVTDLVVAIQGSMNGEMLQALLDAQERGIEIIRMPVAYEELLRRLPIQHLESDWVLRSFVDELRVPAPYVVTKRIIDVLGGTIGVLVYLIMYPLVAVAIMIESGRPITFRQWRRGKGGRRFQIVKFRTMVRDAEADGQAHWAKEGDPRATGVGRLLRKMHIDEVPQFWNVLKGEMSLVGPRPERPELIEELEQQIPFYRARLLVKPGITGWAQVNYGKGASVEGSAAKLEYDLYYIKHRSLLMDLWIILNTFGSVLRLRGV